MRRGVRLKGIKRIRKPSGRVYLYRSTPAGLVRLPDLPENDPRFLAAYLEAEGARPARLRGAEGSIAALCGVYLASPAFARLAASTRVVRRRVVEKIAAERGAGMLRDLRAGHLRRDLAGMSPGAASNRLKAWRAMLAFAVERGDIEASPAANVKAPRGTVTPHVAWTAEDVARYREAFPIGTPERLDMEVICWTAARCVDAARLGSPMLSGGWLTFTQAKTGQPVSIPVTAPLPPWLAPLESERAHLLACLPRDRLIWIATGTGKPRSVKALSQRISALAKRAGLPPDRTAHGLRKYRANRLAELGASPHQVGAWLGDVSLGMVELYTRAADRRAVLAGPEQERNLGNRVAKFPKEGDL